MSKAIPLTTAAGAPVAEIRIPAQLALARRCRLKISTSLRNSHISTGRSFRSGASMLKDQARTVR